MGVITGRRRPGTVGTRGGALRAGLVAAATATVLLLGATTAAAAVPAWGGGSGGSGGSGPAFDVPQSSLDAGSDVVRVAKDDVHPDQLVIVAVGDRAKIEPGLKELNIAPIEYADRTGNITK